MIRPLRRRHRWMVALVGAVAAPLYVAALLARPAPAVQETLPDALAPAGAMGGGSPGAPAPLTGGAPGGRAVELPTTPPIRLRAAAGGAIEATADGFVEGADLLLYWAPAEGSRSIAEAFLLGALRGGERQRFALPAAAGAGTGVLILYSLGHGEEIAYASWPASAEAAP